MTDHQPDDHQACLVGQHRHRAHDGMLVCTSHAQQIATWLRDIEDQAALLDPRKSMAINAGSGKGGGLASQQSPVRLDHVVLRDPRRGTGRIGAHDADDLGLDDTPSVLGTLGSWAQLVREERHLTAPAGPATVSRERGVLSRQLPWILGQQWVDELHEDLRQLAHALRRANGTQDVPAGRCTTLVDGTECGGTIRHVAFRTDGRTIPADQADPDDEPGFRCARCRRTWTGTEAVRLRTQLWLDEQAREATA